jgi:phospholipid/cholesterol/gamma-HCH transport system substrate-binding protein
VKLAIQKNLREFIAIIVMVVLAMFVGGYILSNQRFYLPAWVPVLGTDFFELKAEFATAQSVTPGQGQTVQIAGVSVGEIKKVNLEDGRAVVTLAVRRKDADMIKQDATMLLRPKTGLKDMVIQMDPGTQTLPAVKEGFTIPVSQTEPDVNLDEILASLDRDTRDYLRLLIAGGGEGLKNNGRNFANAFRRFEPLNRDVAKLTGELSKRRKNLGRLIHNLQLLVTEVGTKDKELAELIVSQNAVFESFANQDANLREFLRELPTALRTTNKALSQSTKLTDQLGPALKQLRPGARALAPAQRAQRPFARQTIPPIKNQIRPFARAAQPTVAELKPALQDFEKVTPKLATTFDVLNEVFDALTYNPKGTTQEGYLFWASWLNHIGASVYTTQDAHGLIRRGIIFTDCIALGALEATRKLDAQLGTLIDLSNFATKQEACG